MRPHKNGIQFGDVHTKYNKADYNKFSNDSFGVIIVGLLIVFLPIALMIISIKIAESHPILAFILFIIGIILGIYWIIYIL